MKLFKFYEDEDDRGQKIYIVGVGVRGEKIKMFYYERWQGSEYIWLYQEFGDINNTTTISGKDVWPDKDIVDSSVVPDKRYLIGLVFEEDAII